MGIVREQLGNKLEFFLFSDDIEYVENSFSFVENSTIVRGNRPWEDLALMARCRHHIIANSTFSWWAAWLAKSPGQIVISPRTWFNTNAPFVGSIDDRIPSGWVMI
jgi:hypothetical protein